MGGFVLTPRTSSSPENILHARGINFLARYGPRGRWDGNIVDLWARDENLNRLKGYTVYVS